MCIRDRSNELIEWKTLFSKLKAKDGKYSVLGNHDYGDYVQWSYKNEKKLNFQMLLDIQKEMGFNLLLNENTKINKNNS